MMAAEIFHLSIFVLTILVVPREAGWSHLAMFWFIQGMRLQNCL